MGTITNTKSSVKIHAKKPGTLTMESETDPPAKTVFSVFFPRQKKRKLFVG